MTYQSFLPILTPSGRITHLVAIPTTSFSDNDFSITIAGRSFPLTTHNMRSTQTNNGGGYTKFFGILFPERAHEYGQVDVPGAVPISGLFSFGENIPIKGMNINPAPRLDWLRMFFSMGTTIRQSEISGPTQTQPEGEVMVWDIDLPGNASCSYFDVDWVSVYTSNTENTPESISVSQTSDTTVSSCLKAFIVQASAVLTIGGPPQTLIRFIRTNSTPIPAGVYGYPATIVNKDGTSFHVLINIKV